MSYDGLNKEVSNCEIEQETFLTAVVSNYANLASDCAVQESVLAHVDTVPRLILR
jgi:hypothetical protein